MTLPRKQLRRIEQPGHARDLTCSCYHGLPLFQNEAIKRVFVRQLDAVIRRHPVKLVAWVLMPEHFHLLVFPDISQITIPQFLVSLKQPIARVVLGRWRELRAPILDRLRDSKGKCHFWQPGGGYDRNLLDGPELPEKVGYIHLNPVRRGYVDRPRECPGRRRRGTRAATTAARRLNQLSSRERHGQPSADSGLDRATRSVERCVRSWLIRKGQGTSLPSCGSCFTEPANSACRP